MLQVGTVALFQKCHQLVEIQSLVDLVSRWSWWMKPRNRLVMNRYSVESLREQSRGWIIVILVNTRLSRRCSRTSCMDWQYRRLFQQTLCTALDIYSRACGSPKGGTSSLAPRGTATFLGVMDLLWLVCIIPHGHRLFRCPSITTTVQGGMWGEARRVARRLAWERLARSLLSCVSSNHRSNSAGPNRSRGSISRTTR